MFGVGNDVMFFSWLCGICVWRFVMLRKSFAFWLNERLGRCLGPLFRKWPNLMPDCGGGAEPDPLRKARSTNLLQWHTWFWCIGILFAARALYDIWVHDFIRGEWMTKTDDPGKNYDEEHQMLAHSKSHGLLRICAIVAPFVAFGAACLSVTHVFVFTRTLHHRKMAKFWSINNVSMPGIARSRLTTLMDNVYARNYDQPTTSWDPRNPFELRVNTVVKVKGEGVAKILYISEINDDIQYQILYGEEQDGEILYGKKHGHLHDGQIGTKDYKGQTDLEPYVPWSNPWNLTLSEDLALLVGIMPMVFAVACLFAEIRFLQELTDSNMAPPTGTVTKDSRESYELWRRQTGVMDLEGASTFQYLTVLAFAQICAKYFSLADIEAKMSQREKRMLVKFNRAATATNTVAAGLREDTIGTAVADELREANEEHEKILCSAGMQGIGAYIVVGTLRSLLNLGMATASLWYHDQEKIANLSVQVMSRVQPVFAFTAVLCLWNWSTISQIKALRSEGALGYNASLKFIGVRILLLVSDVDRSLLFHLCQWHNIDPKEENLIHVCVMSCLCFLVALWNFYVWNYVPKETIVDNSATQPLLG